MIMSEYFDHPHIVADDEIDAQQHVHNLRYLQWSLWAAGGHTRAMGLDTGAELERGFGFVVREHGAVYRAAALAGQKIVVRTWISQIDRFSSWRKSYICRLSDRCILTKVDTRWVYADLKRHKVAEIPPQIRRSAKVLSAPPPMPWNDGVVEQFVGE